MKNVIKVIAFIIILTFTSCKKPIAYYTEAITAYADANAIEMTFYGRGSIPGVNDTKKKP